MLNRLSLTGWVVFGVIFLGAGSGAGSGRGVESGAAARQENRAAEGDGVGANEADEEGESDAGEGAEGEGVAGGTRGCVRIVNCVPGSALSVWVDGRLLWDEGYLPGEISGGIVLEAGRREIRLFREGVAAWRGTLEIGGGESYSLVAGLEYGDERSPQDGRKVAKFRVLQLPHGNLAKGLHFYTLVPDGVSMRLAGANGRGGKEIEVKANSAAYCAWAAESLMAWPTRTGRERLPRASGEAGATATGSARGQGGVESANGQEFDLGTQDAHWVVVWPDEAGRLHCSVCPATQYN